MSMTPAAMNSLKNVSDSTEASVASRTKIAAEPKENDATSSAVNPFDEGNQSISPHKGIDGPSATRSFNYPLHGYGCFEKQQIPHTNSCGRWPSLLNNQTKGALFVMTAGLLWGVTGIIVKTIYAVTPLGPISISLFRLIVALPFLAGLVVVHGYDLSMTRREACIFAGFGFCSLTVFVTIYFASFAYTTVQHASALLYTAPAFVALLSWMILKEHMTRSKITAVVLSIVGAFLIVGVLKGGQLFASRTQIGDLLAIGSGLAYSTWYIFGKVLGKNREPAVVCVVGMSFGALFLFFVAVATGTFQLPNGTVAWELMLLLGTFPTALAYLFYITGLKLIDATRASVFAIVEPVTAVILGALLLRETLSYDSILGFILIVSSIILISRTTPVQNTRGLA
jgi:drug/metabolite transporter (DMT)-like permease